MMQVLKRMGFLPSATSARSAFAVLARRLSKKLRRLMPSSSLARILSPSLTSVSVCSVSIAPTSWTPIASLLSLVDNLKEDRTPEDLLFQVLPTFRIPYSARVEKMDVAGATCFNVNDGQLIACFDMPVSTDAIEKIAQMKSIYAVFRDASFVLRSESVV